MTQGRRINQASTFFRKLSGIELWVADVAIYLLRLSDVLGIDLLEVVRKKLEINQKWFQFKSQIL